MDPRYEILGQIGHGGIGSVERAYDHKMGRQVAVKRILPHGDQAKQAEATKQMKAEIVALSSLQHPHIVTVFDLGEDETGLYVVMELLNGKNLDEIVENSPLTWRDFKTVATQSLEALIAAHDLEMIHSDLKPANIMLVWMPSGSFRVKIVDFGLAKLIHTQSQEEIDQMESVYGSVYFMPPEQFERRTLDVRSDLYSLGCCFYQALARAHPFNGATMMDVAQAHIDHNVRPIHEVRGDIPTWACDWVMWMINRDPLHRPATAREALALFLQNDKLDEEAERQAAAAASIATTQTSAVATAGVAPGMAVTSTHVVPVSFGKKKSPDKRVWIAGAAAAVVLLVGASVWLANRNERVSKQQAYVKIVAPATQPNVKNVYLDAGQLQTVTDFMITAEPGTDLDAAYETLRKATASDDSDLDAAIAAFATRPGVSDAMRRRMFKDVIAHRKAPGSVPVMIEYIEATKNSSMALSAFEATLPGIDETHAEALAGLIARTEHQGVRQAAEAKMSDLISISFDHKEFEALISRTAGSASRAEARESFKRLAARCAERTKLLTPAPAPPKPPAAAPPKPPAGGPAQQTSTAKDDAKEVGILLASFDAANDAGKRKIIADVAKQPTNSSHGFLLNIASSAEYAGFKTEVLNALMQLNSHPDRLARGETMRSPWIQIVWRCDKNEQFFAVLDSLAKIDTPWAKNIIEELSRNKDAEVSNHATKILEAQK